MNEKLIEQLIEYLKLAGDFVTAEAPVFVHEILNYYWVYNLFQLFVSVIFIILCSYFLFRGVTNPKMEKEFGLTCMTSGQIICNVINGFLLLVAVISLFKEIEVLFKINYCPKLFLLEVIRGLT